MTALRLWQTLEQRVFCFFPDLRPPAAFLVGVPLVKLTTEPHLRNATMPFASRHHDDADDFPNALK